MSDLRVLCYCNAVAPTGFSKVFEQVFLGLVGTGYLKPENVTVHAINYHGSPHNLPFRIYPAQIAASHDPDLFGRARFAQMVLSGEYPPFDILWTVEDTFTLAQPVPVGNAFQPFLPGLLNTLKQQVAAEQRPPFRSIQYIPIDAEHPRLEWINWIEPMVDHPVAYTKFGRRVMCDLMPTLADKMAVIPHGTNPETFFPVPAAEREQFRQQVLQLKPGQPLVVNVNRNQPRKDIPRTLQVFREIRRAKPDAKLLLHMNIRDSAGYDLDRIRQNLQIPSEAVLYPSNFSEGHGVPVEVLNRVYNAADVYFSTARGEGWGLCPADSMSAGVPVVLPDHTANREIIEDSGGGVLVPNDPYRNVIIMDNDQPRPVVDVEAMAKAVCDLLDAPAKRAELGRAGRAWAERTSWKGRVVPEWQRIFEKCEQELRPPVAAPRQRFRVNA